MLFGIKLQELKAFFGLLITQDFHSQCKKLEQEYTINWTNHGGVKLGKSIGETEKKKYK